MPKYTPPPPTLEHLNPIQRYMQKGELERQDWMRLGALILIYFVARPYIQKVAKWIFSTEEIEEGEKAQKEYIQRRAKVSANAIRSGKKDKNVVIDDLDDEEDVVTSGSKVDNGTAVVNRKNKPQSTKKSEVDQLLDWDDEPKRAQPEGEKGDVMQWLDKWDN